LDAAVETANLTQPAQWTCLFNSANGSVEPKGCREWTDFVANKKGVMAGAGMMGDGRRWHVASHVSHVLASC
jgi:hypothetical protein